MTRPRAFVESPAGLAAVSLSLHGGRHCRPPISRMGGKAGFALPILAAMGLRPGQGADRYLWAEGDADVLALLRAYPDAALLRRVAEIIRGWSDEEPRALWERLRAERKARPTRGEPALAGWILAGTWSYKQGEIESGYVGPGARRQDTSAAAAAAAACNNLAMVGEREASAREIAAAARTMPQAAVRGATDGDLLPRVAPSGTVRYGADTPAPACDALAEYAQLVMSNRLIPGATSADGRWVNAARDGGPGTRGGASFGGAEFATPPAEVAAGFDGVAEHAAAHLVEHAGTHPGGADFRGLHIRRPNVDGFIPSRDGLADAVEGLAREVAGFQIEDQWAFHRGEPESGFNNGVATGAAWNADAAETANRTHRLASRWPPVYTTPKLLGADTVAGLLGTPGDLEGVVVYMDPDYQDTTGYLLGYPRADVVADAIAFASMGALVVVSEAVAIPELMAFGWHSTNIARERKGQKLTFRKAGTGEWLTMNRPPVVVGMAGEQQAMFGAPR